MLVEGFTWALFYVFVPLVITYYVWSVVYWSRAISRTVLKPTLKKDPSRESIANNKIPLQSPRAHSITTPSKSKSKSRKRSLSKQPSKPKSPRATIYEDIAMLTTPSSTQSFSVLKTEETKTPADSEGDNFSTLVENGNVASIPGVHQVHHPLDSQKSHHIPLTEEELELLQCTKHSHDAKLIERKLHQNHFNLKFSEKLCRLLQEFKRSKHKSERSVDENLRRCVRLDETELSSSDVAADHYPAFTRLCNSIPVNWIIEKQSLVLLRTGMLIGEAFETLHQRSITAAPLLDDKTHKIVGIIDLLHILIYLIRAAQVDTDHQDRHWRHACHHPLKKLQQANLFHQWVPFAESDHLGHLLKVFTTGVERVPIINHTGTLVAQVSQYDILHFFASDPVLLYDYQQRSIGQLETYTLFDFSQPYVYTTTVLREAIRLFQEREVDALPVLSPNSCKFVCDITIDTFRSITPGALEIFWRVSQLTVFDFLRLLSGHGQTLDVHTLVCGLSTPILNLFRALGRSPRHRAWIVTEDSTSTLIGKTSLTEIAKGILHSEKEGFEAANVQP